MTEADFEKAVRRVRDARVKAPEEAIRNWILGVGVEVTHAEVEALARPVPRPERATKGRR